MAYKDLGESYGGPECAPAIDVKPSKHYPSFHVKLDAVPDLKIGEVVEAKVKIKLCGVTKRDYDKGKTSCDFEIEAIDFGAQKKKTDADTLSDVVSDDLKEMNRK